MKQAIIIAAGEGQRLRPFTVTKPKVMLAIAGKPILQYAIESLAQNGIRNIILVVGYHKEQIYNYFGSGEKYGVDITYVTQERQLGTAHALLQARNKAEDEFLVLSGDNLIGNDTLSEFVTVKPASVLLKRVENPARYGVVSVEEGRLKEIIEKPQSAMSNLVNTGIYSFTRDIFKQIEELLGIPDVINGMLATGFKMKTVETSGTWLDVVYPWDILKLNEAVLRQAQSSLGGTIEKNISLQGNVVVGKGTIIRSNSYIVGPVVIGENCDIGPDVCILPSTSIGDNVVISSFTEVRNSVIGHDISIGPGCAIQDSVIDSGCVIKGHFIAYSGSADINIDNEYYSAEMGVMIGENCRLGSSVVCQPGVILGNQCQVGPLKSLSGRIQDKSMVL